MRRGAFAILLFGAGCRQLLGIDDPTVSSGSPDAATIDTLVDVPGDGGRLCVGSAPYEVCMSAPGPLALPNNTVIDTMSDPRCTPAANTPAWTSSAQPMACFLVGSTISIGSLRAFGSRPLVIVATETVTVNGPIDVASHRVGNVRGPGSPWPGCAAFPVIPGPSSNGAGGGAGASFGGAGGNGGRGSDTFGGSAPPAAEAPMVLRPGCAGQPGGGFPLGALGGGGGGAIYLAARTSITLNAGAHINASGAGGYPTDPHDGGSGGGSGGMIAFFAQQYVLAAGVRIVANGGGGAGGQQNATNGPGEEANPTTGLGGGAGGPSTGEGGAGGRGGSILGVAETGFAASLGNTSGGGGGGGGVGYIQANHPFPVGTMISPPATVP